MGSAKSVASGKWGDVAASGRSKWMTNSHLLWQPRHNGPIPMRHSVGWLFHICWHTETSTPDVPQHQDIKADKPLPLPECLNVECNRWAKQVPVPYPNNTPMINVAYPQLQIGSKVVIWQLQSQLHDTTTFPSYQSYLQNKFEWTGHILQYIHWKVHQLAQQHLTQAERCIISKIHSWVVMATWSAPCAKQFHQQAVPILLRINGNCQLFSQLPTLPM